jgi:putative PIN family toxin of toxin-antitoxin system
MRVVVDTNVLVAAFVFPGGAGEAALRRIIEGRDELLLSKPILDELLGVLGRKFARDAEELSHVAVFLDELATMVAPRRRLRLVTDDADNRILECAASGRAEAIVTGDKALLALKRFEMIPIETLASYLAR